MFSGFCAGMFGVGGGVVLVPILTSLFAAQQFPHEHVLHLALGCSMATIVFTSISSLRAHNARGAVLWPVVLRIAPGIVIGTLLGSQLASHVPTRPLGMFFAAFVCFVALQMLLNVKPKPHRQLPGSFGMTGVGIVIGAVSALVAIGGGSLSVPFMTWCNVKVQHAIGTSAAIGLPIALSGAVGYAISGWSQTDLPAGSLGYLYVPAVAGTALASVISAPLGARVTHSMPPASLQKYFAALLLLLAAKMLHTLFF
ncbi:MAG: sulfite exporter TauE/SafE family protein [Georgfuchsia sp.]